MLAPGLTCHLVLHRHKEPAAHFSSLPPITQASQITFFPTVHEGPPICCSCWRRRRRAAAGRGTSKAAHLWGSGGWTIIPDSWLGVDNLPERIFKNQQLEMGVKHTHTGLLTEQRQKPWLLTFMLDLAKPQPSCWWSVPYPYSLMRERKVNERYHGSTLGRFPVFRGSQFIAEETWMDETFGNG